MKIKFKKKAHILLLFTMILGLLVISSSLSAASQAGKSQVLLVVGDTIEESPVSGVKLEIYRRNDDGSAGEKIGDYVSETEATGQGHIRISLDAGNYLYRVSSEEYFLPGEAEWESFAVEGEETTVLLWVTSTASDAEAVEIEEEEIAQGAPTASSTKMESSQTAKTEQAAGKEAGFNLGELVFGVSGGVWITLAGLAVILFGVIGLDYAMRNKR